MGKMVSVDANLLARAAEYVGMSEQTELVHRALRELIEREAGRRLAAMGGTMRGVWAPNEGDEPDE